jgi:hypothetical protein
LLLDESHRIESDMRHIVRGTLGGTMLLLI